MAMNFLFAVESYITCSLEDYGELHVYISGAFLRFGVKDGVLEPEK